MLDIFIQKVYNNLVKIRKRLSRKTKKRGKKIMLKEEVKHVTIKVVTLSQKELKDIIAELAKVKQLSKENANVRAQLDQYSKTLDMVMAMGVQDITEARHVLFIVEHYINIYGTDNNNLLFFISETLKDFSNTRVDIGG